MWKEGGGGLTIFGSWIFKGNGCPYLLVLLTIPSLFPVSFPTRKPERKILMKVKANENIFASVRKLRSRVKSINRAALFPISLTSLNNHKVHEYTVRCSWTCFRIYTTARLYAYAGVRVAGSRNGTKKKKWKFIPISSESNAHRRCDTLRGSYLLDVLGKTIHPFENYVPFTNVCDIILKCKKEKKKNVSREWKYSLD